MAELHERLRKLVVFVTIPNEDPFKPERLNRIFDTTERVIVAHVPGDIPIRDDGESWSVSVYTTNDDLIDGIMGGRKQPGRTERLSDGLGPPSR